MTKLTIDSTATLKSNTMEGALLELVTLIRINESILSNNPQALNNISLSISYDDLTADGTVTFPLSISIDNQGDSVISAINYLSNVTYSAGISANTLKSSNPINAVIELIQRMQTLETVTTNNPTGANKVTGKTDNELLVYTGTFNLNLSLSIGTNGALQYTAKEYLT